MEATFSDLNEINVSGLLVSENLTFLHNSGELVQLYSYPIAKNCSFISGKVNFRLIGLKEDKNLVTSKCLG
ncbi:hypothetical protein J2X69_001857 [Algoriphagus sp. 4150]|nr:hypothetical protein [Algoriphagus sp. 4150]